MNKSLSWHIENQIGYINLTAPPKNEMHPGFFDELNVITKQIQAGKKIKGIIIHAEGRHFSSGANIESLLAGFNTKDKTPPKFVDDNNKAFYFLQTLAVPIVACLKGICFGSALELALCAHFRIAAPNSLLSLPETGFHIIPRLSGIYNTQKIIGNLKTFKFVLQNEVYNAVTALENGLVDLLEEKHNLISTAEEFIRQLPNKYNRIQKQNYLRAFTETRCS